MADQARYDIVLLGATGYTGKLTAEYLASSTTTTDLSWAIAGRSQSKLEEMANSLKSEGKSNSRPNVITMANLDLDHCLELAKSTKIILNCVGPYHKYSTSVVEACASSGTHYIDVTGELPWVKEMIDKYDEVARRNRAVLIPQCGVESAPSDLIAFSAAKLIRDVWDCGVMDMVASVHELKTSGPSGGTLATGLGLLDHYSISQSQTPYPTTYRKGWFARLTDVWKFPLLGQLCPSITASVNRAVVHRSAGKFPDLYGYNFNYAEYMAVNSAITGLLISFALTFFTVMLVIPPIRALAKILVPFAPGTGPTTEQSVDDRFEMRGVAMAEQLSKVPRKAFVTFAYQGSLYNLTAILLAEAGLTLLRDQNQIVKQHGYGFLTPSTLGQGYVERLEKANVEITTKQIGDTGSK